MLQLTPEAAKHLRSVRDGRGLSPDHAVRFIRNGAGVGLTFGSTPEPGDRLIEGAGVQAFLSSEAAQLLDGTVIDARPQGGETVLVIRRPKSDRESAATE
jgi:Fe-S cluster assembly iron-binding protein IscA